MMTRLLILLTLVLLRGALPAFGITTVVTASTDLADITRQLGGARVTVDSLARGDQDLHRIEPRPSFVTKLAQADLVVRIGMDLDLWMDALLRSARNAQVREGGKGYVDASAGIAPLEVPTGKVDGASGDIHLYGNPHYWLDPANGKIIAKNILAGLVRVDAGGAEHYRKNYATFCVRLDEKLAAWKKQLEPLQGAKIVTYHTTWSYFNRRFGLVLAGTVEVKPGIPPSASHLNALLGMMKREQVQIVMTTGYYPARFTQLITRETGATAVVLPTSVGGSRDATDYFALFDTTVARLRAVK